MSGLLVAGTSSDAGKSLVVTGLCRALRRRGIDVAPYKGQNMSNNSMVCADGEIGRAQYLQANAARVTPSTAMNPVLLKPGTDRRSFIVLRGEPFGTLEAGEYTTSRRHLAEAAWDAYRELEARHEIVICEGAGSPAEINLRRGDYTNMGLAREMRLPVVLVGDIDRGGVLASLYGTWALLEEPDRELLAGYLINKFRGDESVLAPGLEEISRRTGLVDYGVLPWLNDVWLDGEDSLAVAGWRGERRGRADDSLRVAIVRFPRVSNSTDVDALAFEDGVAVEVTADPAVCAEADLLVLPGSRSTVDDLAWMRERGIDAAVARRAAAGRPVVGICGGYQMLGQVIDDEHESRRGRVEGLGLLPTRVTFGERKVLSLPEGTWRSTPVAGYEIHHGRAELVSAGDEDFPGGVRAGAVFGTMWHGIFESDEFRRLFLGEVARFSGSGWRSSGASFSGAREAMIERLADAIDEHADVDALLALAKP